MARRGETLELAVLGLLHEAPMHGYELRKQLNVVLGWGRVLSWSRSRFPWPISMSLLMLGSFGPPGVESNVVQPRLGPALDMETMRPNSDGVEIICPLPSGVV